MLNTPPNLHSFNPYRFMFPNFPAAAAFPGGFPSNVPSLGVQLSGTPNGGLHSSKVLSAAAAAAAAATAAENLSLPLSFRNGNSKHQGSSSPNNFNRRFNSTVLPPSSSLTITPPVSQNGSDDRYFLNKSTSNLDQDSPIDLSASGNNNDSDIVRIKTEVISSDMEDENNAMDPDLDNLNHEESPDEDLILSHRNGKSNRSARSRRSERPSKPLDLTRPSSNTKISL
ncbi:unnamed protein product, partial [Allacma fusca]